MRTLALTLLLAAVAAAEQPKQPATLTNEERLTMENISLRESLLQVQYRELQGAKQKAIADACTRAKIDPAKCVIGQDGTITERKDEAPKK